MFQNVPIPSPVARHLGCFQVLLPFLKTTSVIIFAQKPTYHRRDGQKKGQRKGHMAGCSVGDPKGHGHWAFGLCPRGDRDVAGTGHLLGAADLLQDGVLRHPGRFVLLSVCGTAEQEP